MKTVTVILIGFFILSSCDVKFESRRVSDDEPNTTKKIEKVVGADSDDHGCKLSAGYQWSEIKSDCIRLFESGKRFNPIVLDNEKAVISAFVVQGKDKTKIELFIPNEKQSVLLNKIEKGQYSNGKYSVNDSIIFIDSEPKFQKQE